MGTDFRQGPVSRAVWPWTEEKVVRDHKPSLVFNLVTLAIGLGIAMLFYSFNHQLMAGIVACISTFIFLCARFAPAIYLRIEKLFQVLGHYIGQTLTWLLLVPFFYICFGFGRLVQIVLGRDPMRRKYDTTLESYWQEREGGVDIEQYRRQF